MSIQQDSLEPDVRHLVGIGLPGLTVRTVTRLGAGLDNVAYDVNGELVVRIAREPESVRREAALLARVGEVSPLPVPEPMFVLEEHHCLAYRKVPGTPLLEVPIDDRGRVSQPVGAQLGAFLALLQTSGTDRWTDLVDVDDEPLADWRDEAADHVTELAENLTADHRRRIESFLRDPSPEPSRELVFSHNDLGVEHVLVAPGNDKVVGVIDWSDAALCDPARDFGLILRDLGPAALDAALGRHPAGDHLRDRAWFYARCALLEDLHYGLTTNRPAYADKSLAALDRLFAPTS
ncbi:aminoglycoside phosphotransferase family protein [Kribbella lupini]|uniref:Aminoglycoside phosphotransferase domain-containing protein n=1 Tax=Kribbella lupini TaxID=291602 RepID=A0ABN2AKR5_9ACTN